MKIPCWKETVNFAVSVTRKNLQRKAFVTSPFRCFSSKTHDNGPDPISVPQLSTAPKSPEGAEALYDDWSDYYDKSLKSWDYPAPTRVAQVLKTLYPEICEQVDAKVLDLGCGTGMSGEALAEIGAAGGCGYTGFDISQKSLDLANAKGMYDTIIKGNLERALPVESNSFSAVISVGVLSYVRSFELLFPEICRVMKPKGLFVFTHRTELWRDDVGGCFSQAEKLTLSQGWECVSIGEPEPYMPLNPDVNESSKTIRILAYRKN